MKNIGINCLCAALLAMSSGAVFAEGTVYKCKNAKGGMSYQGSPCAQNAQPVSSWNAAKNADHHLVLKLKEGGHYFVDSHINDKPLNFLIDTGATTVAIPQAVATAAHLICEKQTTINTANGIANACETTIGTLIFGPFVLKNVAATINPTLDQPLLGMNVLQQFKISQERDEMHISAR
ncbi:MAG: TIGR02281 family clan AA aspartic protease [Gallionella sp.]|nr:TIGR02281 family clan AA aspartic protease [Gallionella sp.]MDD4959714.1 TIGR02281 family clan AA aspartic protease [Gallionella sp.]